MILYKLEIVFCCIFAHFTYGTCFWDSSEETKTVDTTGTVNNNVVVTEPVGISDFEIEFILWGILILKFLELIIFFVREFRRSIKRKYTQQSKV